MSTFGQHMQDVATRLINKYGDSPVTFTRVTPGAFTPSTGALASGTTVTYVSKGVSGTFSFQEINNTTILHTDIKYMIKVTTQVPAVGDTVVLGDGQTYRIMMVSVDDAQDVDICYTLSLRI